MRSILALGLLMALAGSASAASVHHRSHAAVRANQGAVASDPRSGFAYAPSGPVMQSRPTQDDGFGEPYLGASQGYAPGERQRFIDSVRRGG
jgi:hypothetical protein